MGLILNDESVGTLTVEYQGSFAVSERILPTIVVGVCWCIARLTINVLVREIFSHPFTVSWRVSFLSDKSIERLIHSV